MTEAQAHDYVARLKHDWQMRKTLTESDVIKKARQLCASMTAAGAAATVFRLQHPVVSGFDYGTLIFVIFLTIVFPSWKLVRLAQAQRALNQSLAGSSRLSGTR
jgi:hypothetical protein